MVFLYNPSHAKLDMTTLTPVAPRCAPRKKKEAEVEGWEIEAECSPGKSFKDFIVEDIRGGKDAVVTIK